MTYLWNWQFLAQSNTKQGQEKYIDVICSLGDKLQLDLFNNLHYPLAKQNFPAC